MKKLLVVLLCAAGLGWAQTSADQGTSLFANLRIAGGSASIQTGTALPATCRAGPPQDIFIRTNDDTLHRCSANNTWAQVGGSAVGAPTGATYITQTADGGLSAEQALGALATGIVKNTTTTGVLSIAAAGVDYVAPAGNVATATALEANGANCSGNNFAVGVDASGVCEGAQPAFSNLSGSATDAQVPDTITASLYLLLTGGTLTDNLLIDNQKELRLLELDAGGSEYFGFRAPAAITTSATFTWAATGQCTGANGGALTINASNEIACSDDDGGAGGGGAPTDATYIVKTDNVTLTQDFALGSLATGFLEVTTTTGDLASRSILGTSNEVSVANGAGGGNPTISLPATIDLGGKTSLEIPNAAAPTVDAFGEIAGDNNLWDTGRGAALFYDGTAVTALIGVLVSDAPTDGQVPKFNTASGTITWENDAGAGSGAPSDASYLVVGLNAGLSAERAIVAGSTGLTSTDGGVNGNWTIDVDSAKVALLAGDQSFAAGAKKTFVADATEAGFRLSPTAAPTTVNVEGDCYFNSITHRLTCSDGTAFVRYMSDPFTTNGDILYYNGTIPTRLGAGGSRTFMMINSGIPAWLTPLASDISNVADLTAANAWGDGVKQTFNPDATNAGMNVGSQAGDPSTPANGDVWYDSTANELTARINGANVALGAGGGAPTGASYVTATSEAGLSAESNLGALATGLVKITVSAGTATPSVITDSSTVGQVLRVSGASTYTWGALDLADGDAITGTLPNASLTAAGRTRTFGVTFDGGGSAPAAGTKRYTRAPFACTISKVSLLADITGSAVIDVWKDTYANYPPTVADTITAAAKPTLSTAIKYEDATLTGWTTSVSAGDTFGFNVDSASTSTVLTVVIECTI